MDRSGRVLRSTPVSFDPYGVVLGKVLYPAWERLRGRPTFSLLAQLRQSERMPADEREVARSGRLRRLMRHAYQHTTHYRRIMDGLGLCAEDFSSIADLHELPLLDRATFQQNPEDRIAPWPPVVYSKTTSGSTGQPVVIRYSEESRSWRDATRWRGFGWGGYEMGDKAMHIWGTPVPPPAGLKAARIALDHKLRRDIYASCNVRTPEGLRGMVDIVRREKPTAILAFAQALGDLARFVNQNDLRDWPDIPTIYGAERLWPHDRAEVVKAFGPPVFETYGCREFTLMGAECEAHDGLHESMENLVVEIVVREPDGTTRAAAPGEQGEVAVTDLHNLAYPFIRYLTGDLAVERAQAACSCGRTLRRFGPVTGRVTETLTDGAGNRVDGLIFNILFLTIAADALQFQVVQHLDRSLTLRLVPLASGLSPAAEKTIRTFVTEQVRGVQLTIELVPEISLSKSGKLARVVVEK